MMDLRPNCARRFPPRPGFWVHWPVQSAESPAFLEIYVSRNSLLSLGEWGFRSGTIYVSSDTGRLEFISRGRCRGTNLKQALPEILDFCERGFSQ